MYKRQIEAYPIQQMIGVQFHPEIFTAAGDTTMHKLFQFLVNKADTCLLYTSTSMVYSTNLHGDIKKLTDGMYDY